MKFDGKGFADKIERDLVYKVRNLVTKPKIVSILVGDDPASVLYTRLKKEAAERVGIKFDVVKLAASSQMQDVRKTIAEYGKDIGVTGMMVQLPVPGLQGLALQEVLSAIPLQKDVDGLRYPESGVVPPVVKAVIAILDKIALESRFMIQETSIVVMGANGSVGRALCLELGKGGAKVTKIDSDTKDPAGSLLEGEVVISCVGKEGLITADMIGPRAVVIDVGAPKGDMTREVYQKASVSVEVPGGVGPVTIASLMANTIELAVSNRSF